MMSLTGRRVSPRLLPPHPDAAGRVHPAGHRDPVQQRQGAGPAESPGQVHEERRYGSTPFKQMQAAFAGE